MPIKFAVSIISNDSYGSSLRFSKVTGHNLTCLKRSNNEAALVHLKSKKMTKNPRCRANKNCSNYLECCVLSDK